MNLPSAKIKINKHKKFYLHDKIYSLILKFRIP